MTKKRLYHLLAVLMVVVLTISACAPAATEAPAATDAPAVPAATDAPVATEPAAAEPVTLTYLADDSEIDTEHGPRARRCLYGTASKRDHRN